MTIHTVGNHIWKGKETTDSQYLIEYRNPDGTLLLPQYGGCWHESVVRHGQRIYPDYTPIQCKKCGKKKKEWTSWGNPDLATPQGFFDLKDAMQAREDWDCFCFDFSNRYIPHSGRFCALVSELVNPLTFPALVRGYLESLG